MLAESLSVLSVGSPHAKRTPIGWHRMCGGIVSVVRPCTQRNQRKPLPLPLNLTASFRYVTHLMSNDEFGETFDVIKYTELRKRCVQHKVDVRTPHA